MDEKPKRRPKPKPVPKPKPELAPVPAPVPNPEPAPKPRRRKKKNVAKIETMQIDWYAVGLLVLAVFTFLPYVAPLLKDREKPKPDAVVVAPESGNVSTWLASVGSDDVASEVPKYVEALRATAKAEIAEVSKIDDVLRQEVESRIGRIGWANWGLFTIEVMKDLRRLREAGKIDASVKSHQLYLSAVADVLEKVGA